MDVLLITLSYQLICLVYLRENLRGRGQAIGLGADIIKLDLKGIGWMDMDRTHLVQEMIQWWSLANMAMSYRVP
jgi:hypothetical protein